MDKHLELLRLLLIYNLKNQNIKTGYNIWTNEVHYLKTKTGLYEVIMDAFIYNVLKNKYLID